MKSKSKRISYILDGACGTVLFLTAISMMVIGAYFTAAAYFLTILFFLSSLEWRELSYDGLALMDILMDENEILLKKIKEEK